MRKNKLNIIPIIKQYKYYLIGLMVCFYFMYVEIRFDTANTEYKKDYLNNWFLPLSICLCIGMGCVWKSCKHPVISIFWWFLFSMAGNWVCRFYFHIPNELSISEYIFGGIFLFGIPIQIWWNSYKNRK